MQRKFGSRGKTLLTYDREVLVSNSGSYTGYPHQCFSQSLQGTSGTLPLLGYNRFLPNPFQFTSHLSFPFIVLCSIFYFLGMGWDRVHLVRRPRFGLLYQPKMVDDECVAVGGMIIDRGNQSTRRKPTHLLLCPPQILHDLTWGRTPAATVESRRLTAWATARPCIQRVVKYPRKKKILRIWRFDDLYEVQFVLLVSLMHGVP
jgi:hypothetical protein